MAFCDLHSILRPSSVCLRELTQNLRRRTQALLSLVLWGLLWVGPTPAEAVSQELEKESRTLPGAQIIESLAEGLDERLAGEKFSERPNRTTLRLENTTLWTEGGVVKNQWHLGLNLHLPNLEDYWALKFDTYDAREEDRRLDQRVFRRSTREERPGARVSVFKTLGDVDVAFEPRVELRDPLGMSYLLKLSSTAEFHPYILSPRVEFFARPERGTGVFAALDLQRALTKVFTLQLLNEGEYQDHGNLFTSNTGVTLHHRILSFMNMSYGMAAHSFNRPSYHLDQYGPTVSWDVWLFKRSVLSSLSGYLSFDRIHRFKGAPGLQYTLAATF